MTVAENAEELLAAALGPRARFRDGQLEAILALVERRARVLVVERTGWGKSSSTSSRRGSFATRARGRRS